MKLLYILAKEIRMTQKLWFRIGGVKQQWGNRKRVDFRAFGRYVFGTLGNEANVNFYIVLFSPLSPFHWPQNTWRWIANVRSIFTITNSVSAIRLHIYRIELFIEYFCCRLWRHQHRCTEADCKNVIRRILQLRERVVGPLRRTTLFKAVKILPCLWIARFSVHYVTRSEPIASKHFTTKYNKFA